tara:strand:- start:248 stop:1795 length:1548 start_codon:yes stop_codon:yes gene_type:complete
MAFAEINRWKNYTRAVIIGNGPSLSKINLHAFSSELTIGVNGIIYNGFEPNFICITDHIIIETHPLEIIFGSKKAVYILRSDLYYRYQDQILKHISPQKIYLMKFNNLDFLDKSVTRFDPNLKSFNVSYSVIIDMVFPLICFLKICNIYLIGIDHSNFKQHSYDSFLTKPPIDPPNPQKIANFNDHTQAQDLTNRYQKAKNILVNDGINVWNMGLDSYLEVFSKINISSLFPLALKDHSLLIQKTNKKVFYWTNHRIELPFIFVTDSTEKENTSHIPGYFQSVLNPSYRLRHTKGVARVEHYDRNSSSVKIKDSFFIVEHGLNSYSEENYQLVSFRSFNKPQFYLQIENSVTLIRSLRFTESSHVNQLGYQIEESSDRWIIELNHLGRFLVSPERDPDRSAYVRLASLSIPNRYLRHSRGMLHNHPYENQKLYLHDSTFQLVDEDLSVVNLSEYLASPPEKLSLYIRSVNKPGFYITKYNKNNRDTLSTVWNISKGPQTRIVLYPFFEKIKEILG